MYLLGSRESHSAFGAFVLNLVAVVVLVSLKSGRAGAEVIEQSCVHTVSDSL